MIIGSQANYRRLGILAEKRQDKEKQRYDEKEEHRVIASAQALIHKETSMSIFVSLQTYDLTKIKMY